MDVPAGRLLRTQQRFWDASAARQGWATPDVVTARRYAGAAPAESWCRQDAQCLPNQPATVGCRPGRADRLGPARRGPGFRRDQCHWVSQCRQRQARRVRGLPGPCSAAGRGTTMVVTLSLPHAGHVTALLLLLTLVMVAGLLHGRIPDLRRTPAWGAAVRRAVTVRARAPTRCRRRRDGGHRIHPR